MYKLCLLITHLLSIFCLFMKTSKVQIIKGLLLDVTDDRTFSFKINEKKSFKSLVLFQLVTATHIFQLMYNNIR